MNSKETYNIVERIFFFFSSMTFFCVFYITKFFCIYKKEDLFGKNMQLVKTIFWGINLGIIILILLIGIIGIFFILHKQDLAKSKTENTLIIKTNNLIPKNDSNYFSRLSLFVITGLSLPQNNYICSTILLVCFLILMGVVYIRDVSIQINPFISFCGYKLYSYKDETENEWSIMIKGKSQQSEILINKSKTPVLFIKLKEK